MNKVLIYLETFGEFYAFYTFILSKSDATGKIRHHKFSGNQSKYSKRYKVLNFKKRKIMNYQHKLMVKCIPLKVKKVFQNGILAPIALINEGEIFIAPIYSPLSLSFALSLYNKTS
jgi:hypothetical protein